MIEVKNMSTLKDLRLEKGYTQEDLAREADVTVAVISRAENGKSISRNTLRRLSKALGVSPEVLLSSVSVRGKPSYKE